MDAAGEALECSSTPSLQNGSDRSSIKIPPPISNKMLVQKPRRRRIRSELDRLLSDEGTRNLLKAIKKKGGVGKKTSAKVAGVVGRKGRGEGPSGVKQKRVVVGKRAVKTAIKRVVKERISSLSVPSNEEASGVASVIDLSVVSVTKRGNVGFVTVACSEVEGEGERGGSLGGEGKGPPKSSVVSGAFGVRVLQSVDASIRKFEQDSSVSIIVVQNSHSSFFCNGIDIHEILGLAAKNRVPVIVKAIKSLISTLLSARKLTVANVTGDCVGFGVMVLPLFDMVYASDKVMFRVEYNALGQSPEGVGLIHNLVNSSNGKLTSLLYLNTPLTASEAQSCGLVTESLWPSRYNEEFLARLQSLSNSTSIATRTKQQLKPYKRVSSIKLSDLAAEFATIEQQWTSKEFAERAKAFVSKFDIHRENNTVAHSNALTPPSKPSQMLNGS